MRERPPDTLKFRLSDADDPYGGLPPSHSGARALAIQDPKSQEVLRLFAGLRDEIREKMREMAADDWPTGVAAPGVILG